MKYEKVNDVDFVTFRVSIPQHGYFWSNERGSLTYKPSAMIEEPEPPFLVEVRSKDFFIREPLISQNDKDEPLFIKFGNLEGTQDDFLYFSNSYGHLLGQFDVINYEFFQKQHAEIKAAIFLLNLIKVVQNKKSSDREKDDALSVLNKLIYWKDNSLFFAIPVDMDTLAKESWLFSPEVFVKDRSMNMAWKSEFTGYSAVSYLFDKIPVRAIMFDWRYGQSKLFKELARPGDILTTAQYILAQMINLKIQAHPVHSFLELDGKGKYRQALRPSNLLSAMWMQILQAFTGERKYRQCEFCKKWADVTDGRDHWSMHKSCASTARSQKHRSIHRVGE